MEGDILEDGLGGIDKEDTGLGFKGFKGLRRWSPLKASLGFTGRTELMPDDITAAALFKGIKFLTFAGWCPALTGVFDPCGV